MSVLKVKSEYDLVNELPVVVNFKQHKIDLLF